MLADGTPLTKKWPETLVDVENFNFEAHGQQMVLQRLVML